MYEYLRIFVHLQKINIFYTVKKHKNHSRETLRYYNMIKYIYIYKIYILQLSKYLFFKKVRKD